MLEQNTSLASSRLTLKFWRLLKLAVIEFLNTETAQALEQFSPYYHQPRAQIKVQRLPSLPAKIAYQKFIAGKAVFTVITKE